ncbi:hypothetical protein FOA52_012841 [Chlamydomonas sp. UWO 241]|nr:hypothetical protein FOA52_012841 [Chlamydomonas sp. UWO 241]
MNGAHLEKRCVYGVLDYNEIGGRLASIQTTTFQHVYVTPMLIEPPRVGDDAPPADLPEPPAPATQPPPRDQPNVATSSLVYLCSCSQGAWDSLDGVEVDKLQPCRHASAVKRLHEEEELCHVSSASAGAFACINDADFHSDAPAAVLLHVEATTPRSRVGGGKRRVVSVLVPYLSCRGDKGDPVNALNRRAIVRPVTRTRTYSCTACNNGWHGRSRKGVVWMCVHLHELAAWLTTGEGLETYDELGLQRYWLPNAVKPVDDLDDDCTLHTCVSFLPICPGLHVKAVRDHLNCDVVGFKPKCQRCIDTPHTAPHVCVHCVPTPTEGTYARCQCGAAWDDSDPVLAGFRVPGVVTLT